MRLSFLKHRSSLEVMRAIKHHQLMHTLSRRRFLKASLAASTAAAIHVHAADAPTLGQGEFRYRVVPNWGVLGEKTPVNNCHGLVRDKEGHIVLLTDHTQNNV